MVACLKRQIVLFCVVIPLAVPVDARFRAGSGVTVLINSSSNGNRSKYYSFLFFMVISSKIHQNNLLYNIGKHDSNVDVLLVLSQTGFIFITGNTGVQVERLQSPNFVPPRKRDENRVLHLRKQREVERLTHDEASRTRPLGR